MTVVQPATVAPETSEVVPNSSKNGELAAFFGCTFAITWGLAALLVFFPNLVARVFGEFSTKSPLYYLAIYAPSLVALSLSYWRHGGRGALRLIGTLRPRAASIPFYALVLFGWLGVQALALVLQGLADGTPPAWPDFSRWYMAPVVLVVTLATNPGPLGEELGWRGYALPRLLSGSRSALSAAVVLGVTWGVWHLPRFFIAASPHEVPMGIIWLLLSTTLLSVMMTWLFRRTNGDVLAAGVLVHLMMTNFTTARLPFLDLACAPLAIAAAVALVREQRPGPSPAE
ncbi:MAG TPA: type II CAAX endopeptidase family protein [Pirellulales bacterium]|nr:type II CAAX endopeptidase family protein [Pirellulales bacterium]